MANGLNGWNIVPLECVPVPSPETPGASSAAERFQWARFASPLTVDQIAGLIPNPLKEN